MKLRPLHDRVLVMRSKPRERTDGGLIIPPSAQEKMCEGEVLAVGTGKPNGEARPEVKPGDVVLFSKYAGTEVTLDGQELLIIREDDIQGVLISSDAVKQA